jgi:hypothetical protein
MLVPETGVDPVLRSGLIKRSPIFEHHVASAWCRVTRSMVVMPTMNSPLSFAFAQRRFFVAQILRSVDLRIFRFVSADVCRAPTTLI